MDLMKKMGQFCYLALLVSLVACSGDDGEVGPQGEQGPEGPAGTANVIYSDWIDTGGDFIEDGSLSIKTFTLASAEEVTALGIDLNTSQVLVYGGGFTSLVTPETVLPLPHVSFGGQFYTYNINNGEIRVVGFARDSGDNAFNEFDEYRYVIVPGGVPASGDNARGLQPDYQNMSYDEIATLFNIPE
ncbi:MAG: hypothetical protein ACFB0B_05230 [Thermonemataceae bacterium]